MGTNTYTPQDTDSFPASGASASGASTVTLSLNRTNGTLGPSGGADSRYGITSVSKGSGTTDPDSYSQLRSVTVIQVGAADTEDDIKDSVDYRLALFSTGSTVSYAKQKRSLIMTQPAYQWTQEESATGSGIRFGGDSALSSSSVAKEFQRQKFQAGAMMSTYRGNAAVEMVGPAASSSSSWGGPTVWEEASDGQSFDSIKGWDDACEAAFVGTKSWTAAFDYHYYEGKHVTLKFGRSGATSIGTSDEARYATEDLYFAQENDDVAGSKWRMLQDGKWPRVSIKQNDSASPTVGASDSKTWYADDINPVTGTKKSHEVSYGDDHMQIALSGSVVNDAIRQSGISQTSDENELKEITPLNCYTDLQVGDSYSFPVGNSFFFNNHAANMGIHVGRSATFNIWSTNPQDWNLSSDDTPPNWASLEKTKGDTYQFHWGGSRSYAETSDQKNSIREGQGQSIENLQSKRTILNAEDVTESATVGFNSESEVRTFDFSNSTIGEQYVSSTAEYGLNFGLSIGSGFAGELNVVGQSCNFTVPPPESMMGQLAFDVKATAIGIKEKLEMVFWKGELKVCLAYVENNVAGAKNEDTAALADGETDLSGATMTARIGSSVEGDLTGARATSQATTVQAHLADVDATTTRSAIYLTQSSGSAARVAAGQSNNA